jgi:hypothetical protein
MMYFTKLTRPLAVTALLSVTTLNVMAQSDAAQLIKAGTADANTLFNGYLSPLMKSFGAGLNSGWFQTAKPHGLGGFDITISANATFAPSADQSYSLTGLQKVQPKAGEPNTAPSIFGSSSDGPTVEVRDKSPFTGQDTTITEVQLPGGLGTNLFAVPTAQLSVGVGFGTDVSVRFMPNISAGDIGVGLFGFAVKHDFKQWIPGMKELPFDLSAMFGYTTMNASVKFKGDASITPEKNSDGSDVSYIDYSTASNDYGSQKVDFKSNAWTTNIIISKKLGPFTPYVGLGYQYAKTTFDLLGVYPITVPKTEAEVIASGDPTKYAKIMDVKDPVSVEGKISGFRATAGFRLKFAVLTIHGDYTFGQYNVASIGIGLNLQSIAPFKM